jgi:hypothetical protein
MLTVEADSLDRGKIALLLNRAGYAMVEAEPTSPTPEAKAPKTSYWPLLLILAYLLAVTGLIEWGMQPFDASRWMSNFMAGFFLVFSFFKLLNVQAFADAYQMYDVLAQRSRGYALAYPFVELGLGMAYVARVQPFAVHLFTLVVMSVSTLGVVRSLLSRRAVRCACLGAVFHLPMSVVTLVEDVLMAGMALAMLFM